MLPTPSPGPVRLLDQVRQRMRYLHYSLRTEVAYVHWIRRFVLWSGKRHPKQMGRVEVEAFLTHLVSALQVSPATHRQALSALLFLYKEVLGCELPWMKEIGRPPQRRRVPVVLTVLEVRALLGALEGECTLLGRLLYGTGLRLAEALALRVKDLDFARKVLIVRSGKGGKDRVVMLPGSLVAPLQAHRGKVRQLWQADRDQGHPGVELPFALQAKYPRAGESWTWHWVFPSPVLSVDPRSGVQRRHHLHESRLQRQIKAAVQAASIDKPVSVHTLRHSFLQPTFCSLERTSARCRNCSGTAM